MAAEPTEIVPDDKDWTFVITDGCPECGFDPGLIDRSATGLRIRSTIGRWSAVLGRADAPYRPSPQTWSPLEYGCHVRDVALVFGDRVRLMLTDDHAQFLNWDQDQSAIDGRYGEQVPAIVAGEYAEAAAALADLFDAVAAEQWQRRGLRSNGSTFTVQTIGSYCLHDLEHHLVDVGG
jgi:hypothetical protein